MKKLESRREKHEEIGTYGRIASLDKHDGRGVWFFWDDSFEEFSLQLPASEALSICGFGQNNLIEWLTDHFFWLYPNLVFLLQVLFTI